MKMCDVLSEKCVLSTKLHGVTSFVIREELCFSVLKVCPICWYISTKLHGVTCSIFRMEDQSCILKMMTAKCFEFWYISTRFQDVIFKNMPQ